MSDDVASDEENWLPTQAGGIRDVIVWEGTGGARYLASGGQDGSVRIWEADSGAPVGGPLVGHTAAVQALGCWEEYPAPGIVSAGTDGWICLWDPVAGILTRRMEKDDSDSVMSLACWSTPKGRRVVSGSYGGNIQVWDPDSGSSVGDLLSGHTGPVTKLTCWKEPGGAIRIASGSDDSSVRIWDPEDGVLISGPLRGHSSSVEALAYYLGDDGRIRLVSGSQDGTVVIWDPETGAVLKGPLMVCPEGVWALHCWTEASGGARLVTGDVTGTIRFWNPDTGTPLAEPMHGPPSPLRVLRQWTTAGGPRLASASVDGIVQIWDVEAGEQVREIATGHKGSVWALAAWRTQDESPRLAFAGSDGIVRVCDPDTGTIVGQAAERHGPGVWALTCWQEASGQFKLASGSLNGTIRAWDPESGASVGISVERHSASISTLVAWRDRNGAFRIASGGDDSVVQLWDPRTWTVIGSPITAHKGAVTGLVAWNDPSGATRIISVGADCVIRMWDPETGTALGQTVLGNTTPWSICCYQGNQGTRVAVGAYDGSITLWDPSTGDIGDPLPGHRSAVMALVSWQRPDGSVRIASGATDGVKIWDPNAKVCVGQLFSGELAMVRALVCWLAEDGSIRLASAGDDGKVRLWDPDKGLALRTVEVGGVKIWGLSDEPATVDLLERGVLVEAIASQLRFSANASSEPNAGPAVVTIEGPWGCGKTTLMELVRSKLDYSGQLGTDEDAQSRRMTVREAMQALRSVPVQKPGANRTQTQTSTRGIVTAWFNPWAHQSGQQIWAGLTHAIMAAAEPVLFPTEQQRERYWLGHNLKRLDRHSLRRTLRLRIMSPLLGAALVAVALPLTISLVELGRALPLLGYRVNAAAVALIVPVAFLVAGFFHTWFRYHWGAAANYLPADLFCGPVTDSAMLGDSRDPLLVTDPLRQAARGSLYLHQHDVKTVLSDIAAAGYHLTVFVDDLDRCSPATTAEVFEAINLFLSGLNSDGLSASFIVGIDPEVIAAHLDQIYSNLNTIQVDQWPGSDPSVGWTYLRKFVQMPVAVPQIPDRALKSFMSSVTGGIGLGMHPSTFEGTTLDTAAVSIPSDQAKAKLPASQRTRSDQQSARRVTSLPPSPVQTIPWRSMEQHPMVQDLMRRRLLARPERSVREAKRFLNVWQLYERVLARLDPLQDASSEIQRACRLVILAEIITRWPSLQRSLLRRVNARNGLQLLAAAVGDEDWARAIEELGLGSQPDGTLRDLRSLLIEFDGTEVANLAAALT